MRVSGAGDTGVPPAKVATAAGAEAIGANGQETVHQRDVPQHEVDRVPALAADAVGTELVAYDFGDDAGAGTENVRIEEQLVPFLGILQGLSPQLNRAKPEYLDEARMGNIINTATSAVYDGAVGVEAMPVWREYQFTEWVPRDDVVLPDGKVIRGGGGDGQGFRGVHSPDAPEVKRAIADAVQKYGSGAMFRAIPFFNQEKEEDTVLVQQFNLGVVYGAPSLDEASARRAMIAFASTKIPVYKQWLAAATDIKYPNPRAAEPGQTRVITPPLWAHRWRLTTVPQSNRKGDFFNWRLVLAERGAPQLSLVRRTDPLYVAAKEFYDQWVEGQVKADYAAEAKSGEAAGGAAAGDVPF